jgi:hypothetical protein
MRQQITWKDAGSISSVFERVTTVADVQLGAILALNIQLVGWYVV